MRRTANTLLLALAASAAATACSAAPASTPGDDALAGGYTQVLFDVTKLSPLELPQVTDTTQEVVEEAVKTPGSIVDFFVLDNSSAHLIYHLETVAPSGRSKQAIETYRRRTVSVATETVTNIVGGILASPDRCTSTQILAGAAKLMKWKPPGVPSVLIICGSDLAEVSVGICLERSIPSTKTFTVAAEVRGLSGAMAGVSVIAVFTDSTRLDAVKPGMSREVERLIVTAFKEIGQATDVTVISGPLDYKRIGRRRSRGRRKPPLLSRIRSALGRALGRFTEDGGRLIELADLPAPEPGVTLANYVKAVYNRPEPPKLEPHKHTDQASKVHDSLLGPEVADQKKVVEDLRAKKDSRLPVAALVTMLVISVVAELVLSDLLYYELNFNRPFSTFMAIGVTLLFAMLTWLLLKTQKPLVAFVVCGVLLAGLIALAVLRTEDVNIDENSTAAHQWALVTILLIGAGGFPFVAAGLGIELEKAWPLKKALDAAEDKLDELQTRMEEGRAYNQKVHADRRKWQADINHISALAKAKYPTAFEPEPEDDPDAEANAVVDAEAGDGTDITADFDYVDDEGDDDVV